MFAKLTGMRKVNWLAQYASPVLYYQKSLYNWSQSSVLINLEIEVLTLNS